MINNPGKSISISLLSVLLLSSCADLSHKPDAAPESMKTEDFVTMNYKQRTWIPADEMTFNPIAVGSLAKIPVNNARTKIRLYVNLSG